MSRNPAAILRIYWIVFAVVLLLNSVFALTEYWHPYQLERWKTWLFIAIHLGIYGVLIANTYWNKRHLWLFAIAVSSIKLWSLLKFYTTQNYEYLPPYYRDYAHIFYTGPLQIFRVIFFENHLLSLLIFTFTYCHWLYLCEKILQLPLSKSIKD
jgi:hypothetical protein